MIAVLLESFGSSFQSEVYGLLDTITADQSWCFCRRWQWAEPEGTHDLQALTYSGAADATLRANISETGLVPLINEQ